MKLGVPEPGQSDTLHSCRAGVVRLDGRIIDFADVLVSVRAMLVGGLLDLVSLGGLGWRHRPWWLGRVLQASPRWR